PSRAAGRAGARAAGSAPPRRPARRRRRRPAPPPTPGPSAPPPARAANSWILRHVVGDRPRGRADATSSRERPVAGGRRGSGEEVVADDRRLAARADADRADARARELLERQHVALRRGRQVVELA